MIDFNLTKIIGHGFHRRSEHFVYQEYCNRKIMAGSGTWLYIIEGGNSYNFMDINAN